ncbi:hypothetical protein [Jeotgalibacillus soli]|uniref:Uncharacterized protein n=1 Tax=Jeotgalibacillus soli TaxID=889306 RepID=A0A0C2VKJ7_9BACL|nr:hypothetical protein [Jeotgalibacillus soli]KIL44981.1 hypothetical protein KP78_25250 [Jeotgalibacillus soli]
MSSIIKKIDVLIRIFLIAGISSMILYYVTSFQIEIQSILSILLLIVLILSSLALIVLGSIKLYRHNMNVQSNSERI